MARQKGEQFCSDSRLINASASLEFFVYLTEMMNENGNQVVPMVTANASTSRTTLALAPAPADKPEKFSGIDFKWWKQKMFFYLTILSLQKFIKEDVLVLPDETPDNERFLVTEAWKHSDFRCKNYILSGLEDDMYNVYSNVETSKEPWIALEKKYKTEDVGLKKFVATKFLDYKMVDNKSVITQVQKLQVIIHDLLTEASMIEKLPPLWKDFKNYLKHKRKEMLLEDLIVRGLEDDMYNVYSNVETSKEPWIALEKKYKTEDVGLKKFVAAKFLDYKMVDNKSVITQVQKLIFIEGLVINEAFQVASMIEKLPPLWKDFKNY
ncbi:uncharacterized protein [Nicotiana tomentosiformis]|uniref:uncharacterized protein n=1 Tax=Nicotiana tomentosiformis TaxID=4098 RepID=UPI00388CAA3B